MKISRIDHVALVVNDIEETKEFYTKVLGMEARRFSKTRKALVFGNQKIHLYKKGEEDEVKQKRSAPGSLNICFITEEPMLDIVAHLHSCGVRIMDGPTKRNGALGKMISVYIKDPDGNLIEISNYIEAS
jgi:catechol 2,3-dioxygenase-like lactoylglutathione lyase family enzyme